MATWRNFQTNGQSSTTLAYNSRKSNHDLSSEATANGSLCRLRKVRNCFLKDTSSNMSQKSFSTCWDIACVPSNIAILASISFRIRCAPARSISICNAQSQKNPNREYCPRTLRDSCSKSFRSSTSKYTALASSLMPSASFSRSLFLMSGFTVIPSDSRFRLPFYRNLSALLLGVTSVAHCIDRLLRAVRWPEVGPASSHARSAWL